jgi:glycosyltransferase involved in cell wall biosynthesis
MSVSIVIPSIGRTGLFPLLDRLTAQASDTEIIVVDDRPQQTEPLSVPPPVKVVAGRAAGPAAARNTGWLAAAGDWIAFLDDDVLVTGSWYADLLDDLDQPTAVAGVQGRIEVPPSGIAVTDRQADTAKLAGARWITADMAYRRAALAAVGGFDERFPRAYREDVDLAFRVAGRCGSVVLGKRRTMHPAHHESHWACLRAQRGNADDALLRRRYGPQWRRRLGIGRSHLPEYAVLVGGGLAASAIVSRSRRGRVVAAAGAATWLAGTTLFTARRVKGAPGERGHLPRLFATSAAIPPLAIGHRIAGRWRHRHVKPWRA